MRRLAVVAGFAALTVLAVPVSASAICIAMTAKEQEQRADVVFEGVALEGPTATGAQRFRVLRYLKGAGPDVVPVATGVTRYPDGSRMVTSVSIDVSEGEQWRILGRHDEKTGIVATSECAGSVKLAFVGNPAPDQPDAAGKEGGSRTPMILFGSVALAGLAAAFLARRRFRRSPG